LGRNGFNFFPVAVIPNAAKRTKIPLSLRFTLQAAGHRKRLTHDFDIFEFHRIEPMLPFYNDPRPKSAFFHQEMTKLGSKNSDIKWRYFPKAYLWLEDFLIPRLSSGYCVRQEGVRILQNRFPDLRSPIRYISTWVDTEVFSPPASNEDRENLRYALRKQARFDPSTRIVVTVGRLDKSKDPHLLLNSVARLAVDDPTIALVYVGDGPMRKELGARVKELELCKRVSFLGLRTPLEIADILRGADVFALSSAYEGMPMALMEGLGCGLPAVSTEVGEVRKVLASGRNGVVVTDRSPEGFSEGLRTVLASLPILSGQPCVSAIMPYKPAEVLAEVYENYRVCHEMSNKAYGISVKKRHR
jgi:glycosyltransferase involved in cell wall biosynthesis